jgi:hypothetical protein
MRYCQEDVNTVMFAINLEQLIALAGKEEDCEAGSSSSSLAGLCSSRRLLRVILIEQRNNLAAALRYWREWMTWRRSVAADDITVECVALEVSSNVATWKCEDRSGRRCCLVIARNHSPSQRKIKSFKKVLIAGVIASPRLISSPIMAAIIVSGVHSRARVLIQHH